MTMATLKITGPIEVYIRLIISWKRLTHPHNGLFTSDNNWMSMPGDKNHLRSKLIG